ncbi:GNAT family N-acetyltransferase [Ovoidimarina sediminis]|uniref:GNAT family N-acetyltransferase n=1 Tax=Ovoidimarina sediminis TaxID=3079856 RepID=UPI00290F750F|nr:GNAT family N-acetyltransferase [Rhodophyticola sp. MJ-SS7]MDU8943499.1 GNAT family N-acetyltransferase [Rhodophyticola sp. MJ-SS7]
MSGIRAARESDLEALSALCLRSKAVWGYDEAFMAACVKELTLRPEELTTTRIAMIDGPQGPVGVVQIRGEGAVADLLKLFVDPAAMGAGHGRRLFDWAVEAARVMGAGRMTIEADPDAAPFYRSMGAVDVGEAPSGSIPGRVLPLLELTLRAPGGCQTARETG